MPREIQNVTIYFKSYIEFSAIISHQYAAIRNKDWLRAGEVERCDEGRERVRSCRTLCTVRDQASDIYRLLNRARCDTIAYIYLYNAESREPPGVLDREW